MVSNFNYTTLNKILFSLEERYVQHINFMVFRINRVIIIHLFFNEIQSERSVEVFRGRCLDPSLHTSS